MISLLLLLLLLFFTLNSTAFIFNDLKIGAGPKFEFIWIFSKQTAQRLKECVHHVMRI